jgi:hypothetical protein
MAESTVGRAVKGLEEDDLAADRTLRGQSQTRPISLIDPKYGPSEFGDRSSMMPAIIEAGPMSVLDEPRARHSFQEAAWLMSAGFVIIGAAVELAQPLGGPPVNVSGNIFLAAGTMTLITALMITVVAKITSLME